MKKIISILIVLLVTLSLVGCGGSDSSSGSSEAKGAEGKYTAGTVSQTVAAHNGDITVDVTFSDDAITEIVVIASEETEGLGDTAMEEVAAAIIEAQSTEVDTVAGATVSSEALIEAVNAAIAEATK